jgi:hypothetical protein
MVDLANRNEKKSVIIPNKGANIICPNCKSSNTRRIQNALTYITNPIFGQGEEWLGYCHECGTLYEYYTNKIVSKPKREGI